MRLFPRPRRPGLVGRRMGNVLPIIGGATMPIRMPAATTNVKVEAKATGCLLIFETPDGPVEVQAGYDMMKAIRIMKRCNQLLAARKTSG